MLNVIALLGIVACSLSIAYNVGYSRAIRELKPRVDRLERLTIGDSNNG
jgi:hypothetical protein